MSEFSWLDQNEDADPIEDAIDSVAEGFCEQIAQMLALNEQAAARALIISLEELIGFCAGREEALMLVEAVHRSLMKEVESYDWATDV
jgi:hypothetical protein